MATATRIIRAPRGTSLTCKGWPQEAALRMLMNNLDPDVAERPDELIVYGGSGKAARNWEAFDAIVRSLRSLEHDETLLVQSGKPVGVFQTHPGAPRAHRQRDDRAGVGDVGEFSRPRASRPHDVRPDDRGKLDLYRQPGDRAGNVRDARGGRAAKFRRIAQRSALGHRRTRRHGRRAAARGHDERRGGPRRRGRSAAHRAKADY